MPQAQVRRQSQRQIEKQRTLQQQLQQQSQHQSQQQSQQQLQQQDTSTETTNVVTQQQSLELVQSLLHGSLSSVLFNRDLFREGSFRWTYFDLDTDQPWSYDSWRAGEMKVKHDDSTQEMRLLERNGSFRTNVFMDLLEGAFDAIREGYLRSMQLKIFKDKGHPENVLETYTWNFGYDRHTGSKHMVASDLELNGPQGKTGNFRDLPSDLARFVHEFSDLTDKLPKLAFRDPGKLFFKPKLFYTDNVPPGYQPRGWVPGSSAHLNFPRDDDLVKRVVQTGTYHGGYHSASVTTSYLQRTGVKIRTIPNDLRYSDRVSATSDLMSPSPEPETPQEYNQAISASFRTSPQQDAAELGGVRRNSNEHNLQDHTIGTSSTPETTLHATTPVSSNGSRDMTIHDTISDHTVSPGRAEVSSRTVDHDQTIRKEHRTSNMVSETQFTSQRTEGMEIDSQDRREQEALKEMTRQQSETQVQDTQVVGHHGSSFAASNGEPKDHTRIELTQAKINQLNEKRRLFKAGPSDTGNNGEEKISCQCGCDVEDYGNMIFCDWCGTWQHCYCYGFRGESDPRTPYKHACYVCLFDGEEGISAREAQKDLQNIALLRRAIYIIEENRFHTNTSFLKALGVGDLPTASEIIRQLRREKVIVEYKKKGYGKNGKPPYQITKTDPGRSELADKYFDPLYRVASYYVLDKQRALADKSPRLSQEAALEGNKMSTPTPQTPKRKFERSRPSIPRSAKRIKNSSPENENFNPGFPAYSDDGL